MGQRWLGWSTPGTRVLLCVLGGVYLVAAIGRLAHVFDLYPWLTLTGPAFRRGEVWQVVTYGLLPGGLVDFVMNTVAVVILGRLLERDWSRGELWIYCLMAVAGAGCAKVLVDFSSYQALTGTGPMTFGLLVAWAFLRGHERISLLAVGETRVRTMVVLVSAISLLMLRLTAGWAAAIITASGGLSGWVWLWLRQKLLMGRAGHITPSERISRLEL